ncbi:MAG: HU family DNA-binding protein [Gemmatimonadota bacterium]
MKKSELIDRVAQKAEMSKAAAARVVDVIFDASSGAIAEAVQAGKQVTIPGFGRFRAKERAARKGRNPQTGKEIEIPASTVVSFSPGKGLKETVAGRKKSGGKK